MVDSGCVFWQDCETCPFPECIVGKTSNLISDTRQLEAQELAKQGMHKSQIAKKLGVSRMQVYRYLKSDVT